MKNKRKSLTKKDGPASLAGTAGSALSVHEIDGYGIVLPLVQNYYPVEDNEAGGFCWGFKYTTGVFEFFHSKHESVAQLQRAQFIMALDAWHCREPNDPVSGAAKPRSL